MRLHAVLLLLAALLASGPAHARDGPEEGAPSPDVIDLALRRMLVLAPFSRPARTLWNTDPIEAARVRGTLRRPVAGETITAPDGSTRTWIEIHANDDGTFPEHDAFRGGYGFVLVPSPIEQVRVLRASGLARLFWNGEPRVGDVYGTIEARLPGLLRRGDNELWLRFGRTTPRLGWMKPSAPLYLDAHDATLPDVVPDMLEPDLTAEAPLEPPRPCWIGVLLMNAGPGRPSSLKVTTRAGGTHVCVNEVTPPPPYGFRKLPLLVQLPPQAPGPTLNVEVVVDGSDASLHLELDVKRADETHKRTFVSDLDGSVQYYAVVPARPPEDATAPPGIVLTLHGASVEALGQARAYAAKPDLHIVAPTNRRPYGFDWEGWGAKDALEALAHFEASTPHDPERVYLTGHSMGGHGTWMVGAQNPQRFAAIAPSAGWTDVWAYGGAPAPTPEDPVAAYFDRAANVHRLDLWQENLAALGVYVLHGDADDNVPVSEAREMRRRLSAFHPNFAYYEKAGAGHWWGSACVDWPPLFDFLRSNRRSPSAAGRNMRFATVDPKILSDVDGVQALAQQRPCMPSRVQVRWPSKDDPSVRLTTENVRRLSFARRRLPEGDLPFVLDEQELRTEFRTFDRDADGRWKATNVWLHDLHPEVTGFQAAFDRRVALVYGTRGTPEQNAWSMAKARFDAETLWYRGNGAPDVLPDHDRSLSESPLRRTAVLYGTPSTNAAFGLVATRSPVHVGPASVRIGEDQLQGTDLVALHLVHPTGSSTDSPVGAVSPTGPAGQRLADVLPFFATGIRYPDWCVLSAELYERGAAGARAAGYYAPDGSIGADSARR